MGRGKDASPSHCRCPSSASDLEEGRREMQPELCCPEHGKAGIVISRIGARGAGLEGKMMNLSLYVLNWRYQQYIMTEQ